MREIVISGDSHVLEPSDLWEKPLRPKFGDAVPRRIHSFNGYEGDFFFVGRQGEAVLLEEIVSANQTDRRLDDLAKAGSDPAYRLKLMDSDSIAAEVINPTWGLWIPRIQDPALRRACAVVLNDWLVEYCSENKKRLIGVGIVPLDDVDWAIGQARRIVANGLGGVMIAVNPPEGDLPYRHATYDPFWSAIQEMDIPVTLHIVTGRVRDPYTYHGDEKQEVPRSVIELFNEAAGVLANEFIFGGILDRFPRLKLYLSEFDASWIPVFRYRVERIQRFPGLKSLKRPAAAYLAQNVYLGFVNDPLAAKMATDIGVDRLLWGSDFPHPPCSYPNTHKKLNEILTGLGAADRQQIVAGNVTRLYNIEL